MLRRQVVACRAEREASGGLVVADLRGVPRTFLGGVLKIIPLTQGFVARVDDWEFERVIARNWFAQRIGRNIYAVNDCKTEKGARAYTYLHRFLCPGSAYVDHRDGDGLNNQHFNLRKATNRQNSQGFQRKQVGTSSTYRGVSWDSTRKKWKADIKAVNQRIFLGRFNSEIEAALAYDLAAHLYFGDFAHPNF